MTYVTLLGAEDVRNAASTISHAADKMATAVSSLDYTLTMALGRFEDLVGRMEAAAEKIAAVQEKLCTPEPPSPA